jgi:hypothetical protein
MDKNNWSLRTLLNEWTDYDVAEYYFCCVLGLANYDENFENFRANKGVFYTKNHVSSMLFEFFDRMAELGILEQNDDLQYRFKQGVANLQEIAYNK